MRFAPRYPLLTPPYFVAALLDFELDHDKDLC